MAMPAPTEARRPPRVARPELLRGLTPRDEARASGEVLGAIAWDGKPRRDTLPAAAFLAAIRG